MDVGDALRGLAEERLRAAVEKYFGDAIDATIVFTKESSEFTADCSVHVGHGIHVNSSGSGGDAHSAFDMALEKIEKQLRRYKRRLRNHHAKQKAARMAAAQAYVIAPEEPKEEEPEDLPDQPVIVAEQKTEIPDCSVSEAVMRMDLANTTLVLFRNSAHGRVNVVYRREDGNIGWIDPVSA